jgi:nucleoid-associated protein YgaU
VAATVSPPAPPVTAEPVSIIGATSEVHELSLNSVEVSAVELIPAPSEIAGVNTTGVSRPSSSIVSEATIAAQDLPGLAGSAEEHTVPSISAEGEARSGALEARDVAIRAAEAEANTLYVAGVAAPGATVEVYADNDLVGEATASDGGVWLVEAEKRIPVGEIDIRAEVTSGTNAGAASVAAASAPFMRYPDGIVLEPIVTATVNERSLRSESATMLTPSYVIIRRGDNLWRIARRNYGRGIKYQAIFAANQDVIEDPHWIFPGQVFVVPTRDSSWEQALE